MVAIAGPESGWINDRASESDVWGMPGEQPWWRSYSCDRVYSWGLWQIFIPAHYGILIAATGSPDPCRWRDYLLDPVNNARIAYQVWQAQGFFAWTAYNNNSYLAYKARAQVAVDAAIGPRPPVPAVLPPAVEPPSRAIAPPTTPVAPPPSL